MLWASAISRSALIDGNAPHPILVCCWACIAHKKSCQRAIVQMTMLSSGLKSKCNQSARAVRARQNNATKRQTREDRKRMESKCQEIGRKTKHRFERNEQEHSACGRTRSEDHRAADAGEGKSERTCVERERKREEKREREQW